MKTKNSEKKHKYFIVIGNLLITYLLTTIIVLFLIFGAPQKNQETETKKLFVPEEFVIYQDYLRVIGGKPKIFDVGVVEATIISINKSEVCAYKEKNCRVFYPNDSGIVKIEKIESYLSYPKKNYKDLEEGKNVFTHFLLTARPVKIKYVTVYIPKGMKDSFSEINLESSNQKSNKIFKPIPKENGYFVFTTKVFYQEIESDYLPSEKTLNEKFLPGLKEGDKFKARIYYNGTLYVNEYEIW
jgi:hypothetical protein